MKLSDRNFYASQALYGLMLTSKLNPNEMANDQRRAICANAFIWAQDMEKASTLDPKQLLKQFRTGEPN